MKQLLLGAGTSRVKKIVPTGTPREFEDLTTLDINPDVKPDVLWDLNNTPYPFEDQQFDEIHAYEVLEHYGTQGDYRAFFRHFDELYRILKPGGYLVGSVPRWDGIWAWGDPGHTRVINEGTLAFLDRSLYGKPPMTDYRGLYKGDFKVLQASKNEHNLFFILERR